MSGTSSGGEQTTNRYLRVYHSHMFDNSYMIKMATTHGRDFEDSYTF